MNNIKIKKEEFDTNRAEIAKAEAIWDKNFPNDYVEFLLQYNGAITYPNWPNLGPDNKTEIWEVERFFSIGDVIIQKLYPMTYTLHDIDEESFHEHNLDPKNILVFAEGERGIYFFNLSSEEYGQIYIANFSGGDGISRTSCNSFSNFLNSLGFPEGDDKVEIDLDFEFSTDYNSSIKVMQSHMFYTPDKPKLGFQRFKEVFDYYEQTTSTNDGFKGIAYNYVDDRLKLNYLLQKGCETDNLLRGAKKADTIEYLVKKLKLNINRMDNGIYPLQNYLIDRPDYYAKQNYELIDELLKRDIPLDWSIKAKTYDGNDGPSMLDKLLTLHKKYLDMIAKEEEFQNQYKRPSGIPPFIKSELIEEKLGIKIDDNWINNILRKISRGNK